MSRTFRCEISPEDRIRVGKDSEDLVGLEVGFGGAEFSALRTIFLTPQDARRLRKALKRAIRKVEDR